MKNRKNSMQKKLIRLFFIVSTVPILILSVFSVYNTTVSLRENTENLVTSNLKQIDDNLNIWLESYEDMLYQIYTNDDVVEWVDRFNEGKDTVVTKRQLRRYLGGLMNTKEYLRSITIITSEGVLLNYDQLSKTTFDNSWVDNFSMSQQEIYNKVSSDSATHVFSTEYGTRFAAKDYYLFHLSHSLIDYKDLDKKSGVVIMSIDQGLLQEICDSENDSLNFIANKGTIISYKDSDEIGKTLFREELSLEKRKEKYKEFIIEKEGYNNLVTSVYVHHDEELGWDIINVTNQSQMILSMSNQFIIIIVVALILFIIAVIFTLKIGGQLVNSVKKIVYSMEKAEAGDLGVRIEMDSQMPVEIETIATNFNDMLSKLSIAIEKERAAEIQALEATINPHFLYNTLDTINWMALEKGDFDISNAISSLASIMRYAIVNSNVPVTVEEETEWLKRYIFLQQFRLKNNFECIIDVAPDVAEEKIYKLLIQPFVENSILHGFSESDKKHILEIKIDRHNDKLRIIIKDNGKGIEKKKLEEISKGVFNEEGKRTHIGMENAVIRLKMYYGEDANIYIESKEGEGAKIVLTIPIEE